MFANLRRRLLRESPWPDADALAQEIIASLGDETTPVDFPGGIKLFKREGRAPIEIADFTGDDDTPFLRITRGDETFDIRINSSGNIPETRAGQNAAAAQPAVFPGKVLSGTGDTYQVAIYRGGLSRDPTTVTVKQLQIDSAETIPVNTWATVFLLKGVYHMQVPVWV